MSTRVEETHICDRDFECFRNLIITRTGMLFGPRKRDTVARAVVSAATLSDCGDPGTYFRMLEQNDTDTGPSDHLIKALTVNETYFFRDSSLFDTHRDHILPELIARHRDHRRLRIWSAGCATGEEPYSLAILLRQVLPDIDNWKVSGYGHQQTRPAESLQWPVPGLVFPEPQVLCHQGAIFHPGE